MAGLRRKADLPLAASSTRASGFPRALRRGRGQNDSEMEKLGPQDVSEFTSDGGNFGQLAPRGHLLTAGPRLHVGQAQVQQGLVCGHWSVQSVTPTCRAQ